MQNDLKILVKFPTRERPDKWHSCITRYMDYQSTKQVKYLITLDSNDALLLAYKNYCEILKSQGVNIDYVVGTSTGKIHACNRDMVNQKDWDIVLLASDDMNCQIQGWDAIIINEMTKKYPDTDGVLWYNDGYLGQRLNTMCILGKKYYDRFGYIYHPSYISLFSDNEFMEVSKQLDKVTYSHTVLFKHDHPANTTQGLNDALCKKNESYYLFDKVTFENRKRINYGL